MKQLRRMDRYLDAAASQELLASSVYGVLATVDAQGQPHATPLTYAYDSSEDGVQCLYFHSAQAGQKLDNIAHESRVAFTVVGSTRLLPDKFSIAYQSVMVFGTISLVEDTEAKKMALVRIANKYSPGHAPEAAALISNIEQKTAVLRLVIEHISGKQNNKG